MKSTATLLPIFAAMAISLTAAAAPIALSCPPSVPVSAGAQAGWATSTASELYLNSAAPISGPPDRRGSLSQFSTKPGKTEWSYTYDLNREFPDGKWLECGYGAHNEVTLSKPIPDAVRSCSFIYRKGAKAGQHDIRIRCA